MLMVLLIIVTLLNVVVATGFSVAGVFFPRFIVRGGERSDTARVFALYGVARSVPLLLVALWAAFQASVPGLLWLGALAGVIQLADAAVGTLTGDRTRVFGPLVLGIVQGIVVLLGLWWLPR